jgi:hypothetical protein
MNNGPVDQWKIACFASRRPWVQIPSGPLRFSNHSQSLTNGNRLVGKNVDTAALVNSCINDRFHCIAMECIRNLDVN